MGWTVCVYIQLPFKYCLLHHSLLLLIVSWIGIRSGLFLHQDLSFGWYCSSSPFAFTTWWEWVLKQCKRSKADMLTSQRWTYTDWVRERMKEKKSSSSCKGCTGRAPLSWVQHRWSPSLGEAGEKIPVCVCLHVWSCIKLCVYFRMHVLQWYLTIHA